MTQKNNHRSRRTKLIISAVLLVLLVAALTLPGVLASLLDTTTVVENHMEAAAVDGSVKLTKTRAGEERYTVKNEGSIPALVRVKIVVNWVDEDGNPMMYAPENSSYSLQTGTGWTHFSRSTDPEEDYWFYNTILAPGAESQPILTNVQSEGSGNLQVTVLAELVQATPEEAIAEAWGMAFDNGNWSKAANP